MDISCILNRRSIRKFTNDQISDETMKTILKAGMFAPSAHNSQPWEFLVVRNKEKLQELSGVRPYWKMLTEADACVIVLANLKEYACSTTDFFIQDCSASTQNILCAAHGLGVGSVWLGCHPVPDAQAKVSQIFNIPRDIIPFSLIALGYPDEEKYPHSSYRKNTVHKEMY